jgi:hypothetical protein
MSKQEAIIQDLLNKYNYLSTAPARQSWLIHYNKVMDYYVGKQWSEEQKKEMERNWGIYCKTINQINYKTQKLLSILNKNSFRSGFTPLSSMRIHKKIAEDIKQWALNQQTQSNYQLYSQLKAKDAILGGIGCSTFRKEKNGFVYEYIDPREIFWDPDDLTSRFENQKIMMRVRFIHKKDLILLYPDKEKAINDLISKEEENKTPIFGQWYNIPFSNWTVNGNSIRVAELYQKKQQKFYTGETLIKDEGDKVLNTFKTFYKDIADKLTLDEEGQRYSDVTEEEGTIIWRSVFTDNILFENDPIAEQIPNQKYFPYTFMIYDTYNGEPMGLMRQALEIQDMLNQTITEYFHFRDAQMLVATTSGQDPKELSEVYANERQKKNGMIFIADPEKIKIVASSQNVVDGYLNFTNFLSSQLQNITGIFDDYEGKPTNAQSGIAIQTRAQQTINSAATIILELRQSVISEGQLMLDTLKGVKNFEEIIQYSKQGETKISVLTEEISVLDFQVVPEPTSNFSTTTEEEKAIYLSILQDPNKDYILTTPAAMERLGLSEKTAFDVSEEYKKYLSEQMMRSQGVDPWNQDMQQQMTQQLQISQEQQNNQM